MRLVAGVLRVTADLERIVKYAFRISSMFGSCSFDFGIWIVAPSVSKMSRSQLNYAASSGGFVVFSYVSLWADPAFTSAQQDLQLWISWPM